jgi:(1->4)-alpha-D-glucan 1-alpha-D-glucosylmutase
LTTSTHDTKRSEDVRARLTLLSEIPDRFAEAVASWSSHNRRHRTGELPDRNIEWLLYQTLVGAWPLPADRALRYMEKAAKEAKEHTSWVDPDPAYDDALRSFVEAVMADDEFISEVERFVAPLITPGQLNSLAMALLKLTSPGVPDIYQGNELWDLSLVDPDNRRPLDWALRTALLSEVEAISPADAWGERADSGLPKMLLTQRALYLRRRRPEAFRGAYSPLHAVGEKTGHVVAYARGGEVVAVAPRLVLGLGGSWEGTTLTLPPGSWVDALDGGRRFEGGVELAELLGPFPVALLEGCDRS